MKLSSINKYKIRFYPTEYILIKIIVMITEQQIINIQNQWGAVVVKIGTLRNNRTECKTSDWKLGYEDDWPLEKAYAL